MINSRQVVSISRKHGSAQCANEQFSKEMILTGCLSALAAHPVPLAITWEVAVADIISMETITKCLAVPLDSRNPRP